MTDEEVINRGVVEFEAERPMIESLLFVGDKPENAGKILRNPTNIKRIKDQ